jgi:ubiquinone/menaquinone biosynthesis C-methylase UbiE
MLDQVLAIAGIVPDHDLDLMKPDQTLDGLTAALLTGLGGVMDAEKPDWVVVQGDTATAMAGALAAYYRKIPVAHVEAGLRSHNIYHPWPEEVNRKIIGTIAALHFAPTETSASALKAENVAADAIHVTGNTVIDALHWVTARIAAERARAASEAFRRDGADWDELRALDLPAREIEQAIAAALPGRIGKLVDIGTGTGSLLELLAERTEHALGLDASREMLALARARLAERGIADHCAVRQADMYRLPLADASQDVATMHMVLHYAEEPAAAIAEAARVLRTDGVLLIVDLAQHQRADITARHAHRWPGFDDGLMTQWLDGAGCALRQCQEVPGAIAVRLWAAQRLPCAVSTAEPAFQL